MDTPELDNDMHSYRDAVHHYLSPNRRDGVKVQWEEPFSCNVYKRAIKSLEGEVKTPLRVLDLGCGIGDGLSLLTTTLANEHPDHGSMNNIKYVGLDISQEMIKSACILHGNMPNASFIETDFRHYIPDEAFDLYLSCGVPYSHLAHLELQHTLQKIFTNICLHQTKSVVVIDVLGRFSVEWVPMWDRSRWKYNMSFFLAPTASKPTMMSFYSSSHLYNLIKETAETTNCKLTRIEFFDRSIMVGRHTATVEFNPALPRYRELVNSLIDIHRTTDLEQLLFQVELGTAPDDVLAFFKRFAIQWDTLIMEAAISCRRPISRKVKLSLLPQFQEMKAEFQRTQADHNQHMDFQAGVVEPILAKYLHLLEVTLQPGLGIGHSLIALAYADQSVD